MAGKVEGNGAAVEETSCTTKKDGAGERKRMGSDAMSVASSRNGSVVDVDVGVDVDAVVGALAEVRVGE